MFIQHLKPAQVNRGFSLVELLIVVAIIAVLAALVFPLFGRARENARKSSCQNNLKQMGLGFRQYVQDYELFPPASISGTGVATKGGGKPVPVGWADALEIYTKSR